MRNEAKRAARRAKSSPAFRIFARAGYAANGIVHGIIGVIVLVLALGGRGEGDQAGAFKAIVAVPIGFAALWLLAVALWGLAAWHAAEGLLARPDDDDARSILRKWWRRIAEWGQTLVFAALGLIAASVALGARPNSDAVAEGASRGILSIPGGPFMLGAIGLAIGVGGIAFVVMGVRRSFEGQLELPEGPIGVWVKTLGVAGFIAKGIALVVVGVLLLIAAVRVDPKAAGGLDGAIDALLRLPIGPWLAGLVGVGFLAYAVFCGFRARWARL